MQQVEELLFRGTLAVNGTTVLLELDRSAAKDGEPDGGQACWNQHDAKAELANRAATGNSCQEGANEW